MKKYFGIMALVLAISASAFTTKSNAANTKLTGQWFKFNGDPASATDLADPSKYSLEAGSVCPNSGTKRCEINAEPASGGTQPDLSQIHTIVNRS